MPNFSFFGYSASDLGMGSIFDLFTGGPFTVANTPDLVTINDGLGDTSFDDAPTQGSPDPGSDQVAFGDIILDGSVVIPDGGNVWNIGEFTVTNNTTGEVGTLIVFGNTAGNPIGMAATIPLSVGDVLTYSNFNTLGGEEYDGLVCFTTGTKIETQNGAVAVEYLSVGDPIRTLNHDCKKICWIGQRHLTKWDLLKNPKLRPVRILAGALGQGLPKEDIVVSRQHRMLLRSGVAERMFGEKEVLVSAINLTQLPGVFVDCDIEEVVYFHLLFDQHEIIFAEGSPTESLFTGPEALKSISQEAREEVFSIFPDLEKRNYSADAARHIPSGKLQKKLIERHIRNQKDFMPFD